MPEVEMIYRGLNRFVKNFFNLSPCNFRYISFAYHSKVIRNIKNFLFNTIILKVTFKIYLYSLHIFISV